MRLVLGRGTALALDHSHAAAIDGAYLHADNDSIEIQYWLPVFSEDVETDVAF